MVRTVIGGLVGGIIIFIVGFIFWATPLGKLAYAHPTDPQSAAIQNAIAQNLGTQPAGAYQIPDPGSREGAAMYANGPVSVLHFNPRGYSPEDMTMILPGFIMALVAGLLMAFGLASVSRGRTFAEMGRLVVLFSLGFTVWEYLATPIFNHFGWGYWIYSFVAESVSLILAGLVVARWFMPAHRAEADAPVATVEPVATEA
jgi:hypothetical protein